MRFALIGCGRIAARHAEQMRKWGRIAAVCDIVPERMLTYALADGCKTYSTVDELFKQEKELDLVAICTPNYLHAPQSILALHHGINVLCEKPLAISSNDGLQMIQAAMTNERFLFVVKQNRYNPPVVALRELLLSGQLGPVHSFQINCFWNRPSAYYEDSWRGKRDTDGGILYTQFSHFIDLLSWLLGDVKNAKSITRNFMHPEIDIEDAGVVCMEMASGAIGTMHFNINAYQQNMEGSLTIFAENGTVKIGGQYLNTLEYQLTNVEPVKINIQNNPSNDYGFYKGSMSNHHRVYEDVVRTINGEDCGVAEGLAGLKTIQIIEMIYHAAGISI